MPFTPVPFLRSRAVPAVTALMLPVLAFSAGLIGPAFPSAPQHQPRPAAIAPAAIGPGPCAVQVPPGSKCGTLRVPESWALLEAAEDDKDDEDSATDEDAAAAEITVPYAIVPARTRRIQLPPLVYLAGERPFAAIDVNDLAVVHGLATDRDVVFVERRGGASATPSLGCQGAVDAVGALFAAPVPREEAIAAVSREISACADSWRKQEIDPSRYGVADSARDLRELRTALGYPSWFVYAEGIAAPLAAQLAKEDSAGVAGVILDTPAFDGRLDHGTAAFTATLERLDDRSSNPGSSSPAALGRAMAALDLHPYGIRQGAGAITLHGDTLQAVLALAVEDPVAQAAVPFAIASIAAGVPSALDTIAGPAIAGLLDDELVPGWLRSCAPPYSPATEAEQPQTLLQDLAAAACTAAGSPQQAFADPASLSFAAEVLVLITPEDAVPSRQLIQTALPHATVASFPGAGTPVLLGSQCALTSVRSWLARQADYRAGLCAADDAAVPVISSHDAFGSPRLARAVSAGGVPAAAAGIIPLLFAAVSLLWTAGWLYFVIAKILRRQPVQDQLAMGVAPVLGLVWSLATGIALLRSAAMSPAIAVVGVPAAVPWTGIVLLVSAFGLSPVWQRARRGRRLFVLGGAGLWFLTVAWFAWYVLAWV